MQRTGITGKAKGSREPPLRTAMQLLDVDSTWERQGPRSKCSSDSHNLWPISGLAMGRVVRERAE